MILPAELLLLLDEAPELDEVEDDVADEKSTCAEKLKPTLTPTSSGEPETRLPCEHEPVWPSLVSYLMLVAARPDTERVADTCSTSAKSNEPFALCSADSWYVRVLLDDVN